MRSIRFVPTSLLAGLLAGLLLGAWASAAAAQINVTTTLDNATTQTSRLTRDGIPSTCGFSKPAPGLINVGDVLAQDAYVVTNVAASLVCYEVKLEQASGDLFAVAYLGTFDPGAVQTNYLGDAGASSLVGSFGVEVPAGATLTVIVHEVLASGGVGQTYRLNVAPASAAATPVPTMTEWAMILMAVLMAGGAALYLQRRRRLV